MTARMCVLEDNKVCTGCGACERCDLDPNKICDNCMRCLEMPDEEDGYRKLKIDEIRLEGEAYEAWLELDKDEK